MITLLFIVISFFTSQASVWIFQAVHLLPWSVRLDAENQPCYLLFLEKLRNYMGKFMLRFVTPKKSKFCDNCGEVDLLHFYHNNSHFVFHRDIQTSRRELKMRRAAEYFWRNSRCLDHSWWDGEVKSSKSMQIKTGYPNLLHACDFLCFNAMNYCWRRLNDTPSPSENFTRSAGNFWIFFSSER